MAVYTNGNVDTATIADAADTSTSVFVGDYHRGSFATDGDLTSTSITFEVSNDNTAWDTLRDAAGSAVSAVTVADNKLYRLPAGVFSYRYLRFKAGAVQAEGGDATTTITVFLGTGAAS